MEDGAVDVAGLGTQQEGDDAGCQDGRFTEGFDTANLKDAKALLEELK